MKKVECFKIKILMTKDENDIFNIDNLKTVKEIQCNKFGTINAPTTIVADPFLFVKDSRLYVFYEDKKYSQNGVISMTYTTDLRTWSDPIQVLVEDCHLSFPFVFEDNGKIYMIPETSEKSSIRLYQANEEITEFSYKRTLLNDVTGHMMSFSDSSVYCESNRYYLFTTIKNDVNELKLFVSNKLEGPYHEHCASPICKSNKYGRNAGCVFLHDKRLYRVSQNCVDGYGNNVSLFQIILINENEYKEELLINNLFNSKDKFYKKGGHQFNFVKFKGNCIVATDAKEYHLFVLHRFFSKLYGKRRFINC